jgi:hypothetical protein
LRRCYVAAAAFGNLGVKRRGRGRRFVSRAKAIPPRQIAVAASRNEIAIFFRWLSDLSLRLDTLAAAALDSRIFGSPGLDGL